MGFSDGTVRYLTNLAAAGHISAGAKVLDFGSQNIHGDFTEDERRRLFVAFDRADAYRPDYFEAREKIERLMAALGLDYVAFDLYTAGRTRRFDFNFDRLSFWQRGRYDLVLNCGTSEHVANQFNLFKTARDALKVGGVMYSSVPFFGGPSHGLVNYHPKVFHVSDREQWLYAAS